MKYFKAMNKKAESALAVIEKMYDKFPEIRTFIDKTYNKECCKVKKFVDEIYFNINNNC